MITAHNLVLNARQRIQEIDINKAEDAIRLADVLIDVREADEFASGHIPGAIHIPRGLLEFKLSSDEKLVSRDLKIIIYCKTSGRAALAAQSLIEMGYQNVKSIEGGIDAWIENGKQILKPKLPSFD